MCAEHAHRGNRCKHERCKAGDGGERGVEHRHEQVTDHVFDGFGFIAEARIGVEKFAENMHRVGHGNRHQEDGNHGAHDVNGIAKADQQTHRDHYADDGHEHRRNDERQAPEEKEQQQKDGEAGQRRGGGHLYQHFNAEGVLCNGLTGDENLILPAPVVRQFFHEIGDVVGIGLGLDRDIERDCFSIFRDQRAVIERVIHGVVADRQRFLASRRRLLHQVFDRQLSLIGLPNIIDHAGADDLGFNNCGDPLFVEQVIYVVAEHFGQGALPEALRFKFGNKGFAVAQRFGFAVRVLMQVEQLLRQLVNFAERVDVKDAVGVGFIDDADDDKVVEVVPLFHLVVNYAHRFVFGKHVFRVIVEEDLGELNAEKNDGGQAQGDNEPRESNTERGHF